MRFSTKRSAHGLEAIQWLLRNDQDAEDMVQEAAMRALKSFGGFRGLDGRAWWLTIVRNTCYTWLQRHRTHEFATTAFDDDLYSPECAAAPRRATRGCVHMRDAAGENDLPEITVSWG